MSRDITRVGQAGFEPTTSSSRTKRATKLRHCPLTQQYQQVRDFHLGGAVGGSDTLPAQPKTDATARCTLTGSSGFTSQPSDLACFAR